MQIPLSPFFSIIHFQTQMATPMTKPP